METCVMEGCKNKQFIAKLCRPHYLEEMRKTSEMKMNTKKNPIKMILVEHLPCGRTCRVSENSLYDKTLYCKKCGSGNNWVGIVGHRIR